MKKMPWGWVTNKQFYKEKHNFIGYIKEELTEYYGYKAGQAVINRYNDYIEEIFGFAPDDTNEYDIFITEHYGPEFYRDQIIEAEESTIKYYPDGTVSFT